VRCSNSEGGGWRTGGVGGEGGMGNAEATRCGSFTSKYLPGTRHMFLLAIHHRSKSKPTKTAIRFR